MDKRTKRIRQNNRNDPYLRWKEYYLHEKDGLPLEYCIEDSMSVATTTKVEMSWTQEGGQKKVQN